MGEEERDSGMNWDACILDRMAQSKEVDRDEMVCISIWGYWWERVSMSILFMEEDEEGE